MALAQIGAREGHDVIAALLGARETARRIGSVQLEMRACAVVTHVLEGRGDHERAIQAGREGLARARQLGLARFAATPIGHNLAESLTSAGRWDEALEIIAEALGLDPAPEGRAVPAAAARLDRRRPRRARHRGADNRGSCARPPPAHRAAHRPLRSWRR